MGRATGRAIWKDWRLLILPAVVALTLVLASGGVVRGAAHVLNVDTTIDEVDGSCADDCSIRDALAPRGPHQHPRQHLYPRRLPGCAVRRQGR